MNYYLDQEFHEYFKKPIKWLPTIGNFNKPYHTIELISIGIVAEDGREYYAVCNEFDLKAAQNNTWINDNVLNPICADFYQKESGYAKYHHSESLNLKNFLKWKGKSKKQIMYEINEFICSMETSSEWAGVGSLDSGFSTYLKVHPPVFYGYYADYDWVLFCSLFGKMMNLPEGFPMYCRDLKQMFDEKAESMKGFSEKSTLEDKLCRIKRDKKYPKQENEHHALSDAKWNYKLYKFLLSL